MRDSARERDEIRQPEREENLQIKRDRERESEEVRANECALNKLQQFSHRAVEK